MMLMQQMANASMGGAMAAAIARAIGAGRKDDAAALVIHALVIACAAGALFSALFLLAGPLIYGLLGGRGAVLAAALDYSGVIFAGARDLLAARRAHQRGARDRTVALLAYVYVGAEVLHFALVPLLVFGAGPIPALGVAGAGIATVTSFAASSLVLACYLASGRSSVTLSLRGVRLQRALFGEILKVGVPMSMLPLLNNVALAMLTAYAGLLGTTALAGFGIGVRLEYLLYPINFGLGAGVLAMVGTNIGARQYRTRRPHRLDRHRPVGRRDVADRRDRHHRARPVDRPVHRRSGDPPRHRDLSRRSSAWPTSSSPPIR